MASAHINGNVGIVTFVAEFDYKPQVKGGEIELKKGDLCVVAKPIIDPLGWLEGTNKNTGEYGQFPGTYVTIVEDYTPPPPPRPPKPLKGTNPDISNQVDEWSNVVINKHRLEKISFTKPVWCQQCQDFIWGLKNSCFWCSDCFFASHPGCSFYFNTIECDPDRKFMFDYEKADLMLPVESWDVQDVLEWVAAIRAYQYIHTFKEQNVTGAILYSISQAYLKKELAVPHDFDVRSIANATTELLTGTDSIESSNAHLPFVAQPAENFANTSQVALSSHSLQEHTFTTTQICDVCRKWMFGLIRQGFMCQACGTQCHRYCAQYGLTMCKRKYNLSRRASDAKQPFFGQGLTHSLAEIPVAVQKMVGAIESNSSRTKDIYFNDAPFLEFLSMRNALNQAPESVNMRGNEWQNPNIAATALKQYLLEMPASVIPPDKYENFIIAANLSQSSIDQQPIRRQIAELPKANKVLLEFLQNHLIRLCSSDAVAVQNICKIFGVLLLRPFENEARKLVKNLDHQSKVVELLLNVRVKQPTPSVPERKPTVKKPGHDPLKLESAEWYWGPITREAASEKLKHTPDGTYLIRDSQNRGEYTLTLRKDGSNKLIKINQKDGKYGFTDSNVFPSLFALVDHFSNHSLKECNSNLDMKLLHPVSKYENRPDIPKCEIQLELEKVSTKMGHYNTLEIRMDEACKKAEEAKLMFEAQMEVIYFVEEHLNLAKGYCGEVAVSDRTILSDTIARMNRKFEIEKESLRQADNAFKEKGDIYTTLEKCFNAMKYEMPDITKRYHELQRKLKENDPEREKQHSEKEEEGIYDELPAMMPHKEVDELPEESWLLGSVKRQVIRQMLNGKPDGTFFVRESESRKNDYVISLVHEQAIKHIPIEKGPHGFGFAKPYNIYPDFKSLVHHYHKQSLRMHNPQLDTTLMFPIRYIEDDDNIYMQCTDSRS